MSDEDRVDRMTQVLTKVRADYVNAMYQVDALARIECRATTMAEKLRQSECQVKIDLIDYALGSPPQPSAPTPPYADWAFPEWGEVKTLLGPAKLTAPSSKDSPPA